MKLSLEILAGGCIGAVGTCLMLSLVIKQANFMVTLGTGIGSAVLVATGFRLTDRTQSMVLKNQSLQARLDKEYKDAKSLVAEIERQNDEIRLLNSKQNKSFSRYATTVNKCDELSAELTTKICMVAELEETVERLQIEVEQLSEENEADFNNAVKAAVYEQGRERNLEIRRALEKKNDERNAKYKAKVTSEANRDLNNTKNELSKALDTVSALTGELRDVRTQLHEMTVICTSAQNALRRVTEVDFPDIEKTFTTELQQRDTAAEMNRLLSERTMQNSIETLQKTNVELSAPKLFGGISKTTDRGNTIIKVLYERENSLKLDAIISKTGDDTDVFTFRYNDVVNNPNFLNDLNDDNLKVQIQHELGNYKPHTFEYDFEQQLVTCKVPHTRPKPSDKRPSFLRQASDFTDIIKGGLAPRIRITGGSETGKSPLAENIAYAFEQYRNYTPHLYNPAHVSSKNNWTLEAFGTNHQDSIDKLNELSAGLTEMAVDSFELYVFDEIDNTITRDKKVTGSIKSLMREASHKNLGVILIGQSANARNYEGWTRNDFNNMTSIHIGDNAGDALENSNIYKGKLQQELVAEFNEVRDWCERINKGVSDPVKLLRWAMVDPEGKRPFFIELPKFGSYQPTPTSNNQQQTPEPLRTASFSQPASTSATSAPPQPQSAQPIHSTDYKLSATQKATKLHTPQNEGFSNTKPQTSNSHSHIFDPNCPYCGSENTKLNGNNRRKCNSCNKTWTVK